MLLLLFRNSFHKIMYGKSSTEESRVRWEAAASPTALFCSASVVSTAHQEVFPIFVFSVCSSPMISYMTLSNRNIRRKGCFTLCMAVEDYLKIVFKQWLISEWASQWLDSFRKGEGVTISERIIISSWDSLNTNMPGQWQNDLWARWFNSSSCSRNMSC